ncbi:MAG: transposase [Candidatus Theseobacter exili]|nr:transposase [Candidatus Theseobacter exili]
MDSLMIASSCRKLSRLEIVFSCVDRLLKKISKTALADLPDKFKVYLEKGYRNDTIYRSRDKDLDSKLRALISDANELMMIFKETLVSQTEEYQLLCRMLGEQTYIKDGKTELKPSKEISSNSLQNPTDPDATYRKKGTKGNIGYTANVVEKFDEANAIISQYDLQQNIYSDQRFSKDTIEKYGKQEKELTTLVDGAYYSEEISQKAVENNINLIPTNLVGRPQKDDTKDYAGFKIDEKKHVVLSCPEGLKPEYSKYKDETYKAHFNKETCNNCPHRSHCPISEQKKKCFFKVTEKKLHRTKLISRMGTYEYRNLSKKRAGIEGIPSVLRRKYDIDHLPVRGLIRSKVYLGFKISAINCKRLIKGLKNASKDPSSCSALSYLLKVLFFQRSNAEILSA